METHNLYYETFGNKLTLTASKTLKFGLSSVIFLLLGCLLRLLLLLLLLLLTGGGGCWLRRVTDGVTDHVEGIVDI